MLLELKCKSCDSILTKDERTDSYYCESCGSRYVFADDEEIINVNDLIREGYEYLETSQFSIAYDCFAQYVEECGAPNYEAYLGYILSRYECKTINQLANVESCEAFEIDEWKTLINTAGNNKELLRSLAKESISNFRNKIGILAGRSDSEVYTANAIFLLYIAEHRKWNTAMQIRSIAGKDELFDSFHDYYIVACTVIDSPAEFYLPAVQDVRRMHCGDVVIVIPEPSKDSIDRFLEEMYEYGYSNGLNIVLVFNNDLETIKRIRRYCSASKHSEQYDVPKAYKSKALVYVQGNTLVLIDGNLSYANNEKSKTDIMVDNFLDGITKHNEKIKQENEEIERRAGWIRSKKCRHCGGEFVGGFLSKTCSVCGKRKDY